MLSGAVILKGEEGVTRLDSIHRMDGIEWDALFTSRTSDGPSVNRSMIYTSPELIPLMYDVLVVLDPDHCQHEFLALAIRKGCHLFISDYEHLTVHQRNDLVRLAQEGGSYLQVQNDFLSHSNIGEKIPHCHHSCFIELNQSVPKGYVQIRSLLANNLMILLRAVSSPVHRTDVYCLAGTSTHPSLINVRLLFENGSVANLTLRFAEMQKYHTLVIQQETETFRHEFKESTPRPSFFIGRVQDAKSGLSESLLMQLESFVTNIITRQKPLSTFYEEAQVEKVLSQIKIKLASHSSCPF